MLSNVFSSPRTTLAGLAAVIVGAIGSVAVPAAVTFLGGQAGAGWQLVGMAIGAVVPALMADAKKKLEAVAAPPAP